MKSATEQRKKWLYGQSRQSTESQSNRMHQYKEFCRLRDYRRPGAEVPYHTEAEAFALAVQNKASPVEPAPQKTNQTTEGKK